MGDFWRATQLLYLLMNLATLGLLGIGLVAVLAWPKIPGRGLMLAAIGLLLGSHAGYVILGTVGFLALPILPGNLIQVSYLALSASGIAGFALLLAALVALARLFAQMRRRADAHDEA